MAKPFSKGRVGSQSLDLEEKCSYPKKKPTSGLSVSSTGIRLKEGFSVTISQKIPKPAIGTGVFEPIVMHVKNFLAIAVWSITSLRPLWVGGRKGCQLLFS
uniref:Uncharacterized protein n=1 Tax=Rhizophora mucronata TaxID=61149 RepID=A0A2P2JW53_RHIMU